MNRILGTFTNLYPVWLIGSAILGICHPPALAWFKGDWLIVAFSIVMLSMGFTLTLEDFRRLFRTPGSLALGFVAHYTIMPLTGWAIAKLLHLEPELAVGLILVACCPSGTASNVVSFLARADVALAVAVTLTSTLLAFIMTPLWTQFLAGQYVPVDAGKLCWSTVKVMVLPVLGGLLCNTFFPRTVARISRFGPTVSIIAIIFITGGIVAQNAASVQANAGKLALAAFLLHAVGFFLGYFVSRLLRYPKLTARTVAIEVGMQNGGLAALLARENFTLQPMAAVPAVFSGVIQNLVGSVVAVWWRRNPVTHESVDGPRSELAGAEAEVAEHP